MSWLDGIKGGLIHVWLDGIKGGLIHVWLDGMKGSLIHVLAGWHKMRPDPCPGWMA